jgi:hypothetical protein
MSHPEHTCNASGTYECRCCGYEITLKSGDFFLECARCRFSAGWKAARRISSGRAYAAPAQTRLYGRTGA